MNQLDNVVDVHPVGMAGYPGTWEWIATLAPMLKNHSNLMKSIGQKVAKYPHLFCLNLTKSEALLCLKNSVCCQFRMGAAEHPWGQKHCLLWELETT